VNEQQKRELAKTRPAPAAPARKLVATSRVFYSSATKGPTLAQAGDEIDPVDADFSRLLDLGLVEET